jgi:hypothetical protein
VLDAICQDFGLPLLAGSRQLEKVQALNTFLLEQFAREKIAAILIDEGQNLSSDALENLRLLSNLEAQTEKLLQIILVGQNELEAKLQQPALRQIKDRVAIWSRLDRLKERDVLPFIEHRLHTVGYEGPDLFTPEAIDRIAVYSYGSSRQSILFVILRRLSLMGHIKLLLSRSLRKLQRSSLQKKRNRWHARLSENISTLKQRRSRKSRLQEALPTSSFSARAELIRA